MAKAKDNEGEKKEERPLPSAPPPQPAPPPPQIKQPQMQQQVQVKDQDLKPMYSNFCRVTGTPEEIILDFGLNTEPFGQTTGPVQLDHRMVCNFFTAKRLLFALNVAIQRHESAFGVLETDVNKRVRMAPGMGGVGAPGGAGPPGLGGKTPIN